MLFAMEPIQRHAHKHEHKHANIKCQSIPTRQHTHTLRFCVEVFRFRQILFRLSNSFGSVGKSMGHINMYISTLYFDECTILTSTKIIVVYLNEYFNAQYNLMHAINKSITYILPMELSTTQKLTEKSSNWKYAHNELYSVHVHTNCNVIKMFCCLVLYFQKREEKKTINIP